MFRLTSVWTGAYSKLAKRNTLISLRKIYIVDYPIAYQSFTIYTTLISNTNQITKSLYLSKSALFLALQGNKFYSLFPLMS